MTALMRIGDEASVKALLPYLRSQDAALRGASIEALQALPEAILPFMTSLLADSDSDVRLLATELARNMSAADATRLLCGLLERRAASQCLRGGDRRAGGGRHAGGPARAAGLRRTLRRNAVSAVRRVDRHCPDFGRGRLGPGWQRSETHGAACRPRFPGGGSALLRIPLPPHRNVVQRQQALLHRSPPRSSELLRPDRHRSRRISPCCGPTSTTRSSISSTPSRSTRPISIARSISFAA